MAGGAAAHPPHGIAVAEDGTLYYPDLTHVWALDPATGEARIVVRNVHTHAVYLDGAGNLYGEDVDNQGDRYWHRVWVLRTDGTLEDVLPTRDGHPSDFHDYSLSLDPDGGSWLVRPREGELRHLAEDGTMTDRPITAGSGPLGRVAVIGEYVYLTRARDLLRFDPETEAYAVVATGALPSREPFEWVRAPFALMGIWAGPDGEPCVADMGGMQVLCVSPDLVVTAEPATEGRTPVAGAVGPDGSYWVLEMDTDNRLYPVRRG